MTKKNLVGQLLVANPLNPKDGQHHSVMMVVADTRLQTMAIQLNSPAKNLMLNTVFSQLDLWYDGEDPVYYGGNISTGRIHLIHTLDWRGMTTIPLTEHLGLTNDISILTAMARGEGPEYFRACAGHWIWEDNELAQQMDLTTANTHRWELAPATLETVFEYADIDQWHHCIEASARNQVSAWF
jgi:putative AlgH/UPF0301 family transcriptional regulator